MELSQQIMSYQFIRMETDEFNEEGDEIATIEYQNIESEGITALTRQLEVRYLYFGLGNFIH